VSRKTVDTSDAIAFLRPIQCRQTEELAQLLGREFPEWTTLKGQVRRPRHPTEHEDLSVVRPSP
jgi:hypothetical protein